MELRESTRQHWDSKWERISKKPTIHELQFKKMKEVIGDLRSRFVLEVGAGSGVDSAFLAKNYQTHAFCIDFSEKALRSIRKNFSPGMECEIIKADLKRIPFRDGCFDVVFSNGVLEHFRTPLKTILEQKRVLRKGGILVIGVPYAYTLFTIRKQISIAFGRWFAGWETQFDRRQLLTLVRDAGMRYVLMYLDCHALNYLPRKLRKTWINFVLNGGVVIFAQKI